MSIVTESHLHTATIHRRFRLLVPTENISQWDIQIYLHADHAISTTIVLVVMQLVQLSTIQDQHVFHTAVTAFVLVDGICKAYSRIIQHSVS